MHVCSHMQQTHTHTHALLPLFLGSPEALLSPELLCLRGTSMVPTETMELTLASRHVGDMCQQGESTTTPGH